MNTSEKEWDVIITAAVATILVVTETAFFAFMIFFRTVPRFDEKNIELGRPVPTSVEGYMTGAPFMHKGYSVDTSNIDNMTVGDYRVTVEGKEGSTDFIIHIVDTTAPYIVTLEQEEGIILELGESYSVRDVVASVSDASDRYSISLFCNGSLWAEEITYQSANSRKFAIYETGTYILDMIAKDESGNASSVEIEVTVTDTVGPEIKLPAKLSYYATGTEYGVMDFASEIYDASGETEYHLVINDSEADSIVYTNKGSYEIGLLARDINGNETFVSFAAEFDDAPEFIGNREIIYAACNSGFDPAQIIRAVDSNDGNISDSIFINYNDYDNTKEGIYTVEYSVADTYGLVTVFDTTIVVGDEDSTDFTLNEAEIQRLIECDYFSYEVPAEDDYDTVIEAVEPALINLLCRSDNGSYAYGSGFVYKVDSDYIYFSTCDHVISEFTGKSMEIMFCDEAATVINVVAESYGRVSTGSEVAIFRLATSSVPASVMVDIRQVYCDENVYSEMYIGQQLIAYSGHWKNETPAISELYVKNLDEKFLDEALHCIATSHNTKGGMSGCPVFDLRGRLVALCEGYWGRYNYDILEYEYTGYQQRIDGIGELYERIKS